jgi:hypothetical protein
VERRHAVHGQVVQVAQADGFQLTERVALLGEEDVVRLDLLERHHPQRVVGKEIERDRARRALDRSHDAGIEWAALDHQHDVGAELARLALEPPVQRVLVRGLRRLVLVEEVVAAVGEAVDAVAECAELVGEIHAHVAGAGVRHDDQPAHPG